LLTGVFESTSRLEKPRVALCRVETLQMAQKSAHQNALAMSGATP
jgi:hypothetical protein